MLFGDFLPVRRPLFPPLRTLAIVTAHGLVFLISLGL